MQNFEPSTPAQVASVYNPTTASGEDLEALLEAQAATLASTKEKEDDKPKIGPGAIALVGGLLLLGPFVVTPWIVKQFKPEWSYGKRVATGFVVSFGVGALTRIAGAVGGKEK